MSSVRSRLGGSKRLASSRLRCGSQAERTRPSWSKEPKAANSLAPSGLACSYTVLPGVSPKHPPPRSLRPTAPSGRPGPWPPRARPGFRSEPSLLRVLRVTGTPGREGPFGLAGRHFPRVVPRCRRPEGTVTATLPSPRVARSPSGEDTSPARGHGSRTPPELTGSQPGRGYQGSGRLSPW